MSADGLMLAFSKNEVCIPIKLPCRQAKALLNVWEPGCSRCSTTSVVALSRSPRCFSRATSSMNYSRLGAQCSSKSFSEMAPVVQGAVIVIMGVSGSGKTTIGNLLAEAANCAFLDADDFHPDSNKEKMRKGIPLSEEDRMPWLQVLCNALKNRITDGEITVLACSALRKNYREILRSSDPSYVTEKQGSRVKFVLLNVPVEVLADRLNKRLTNGEHFMPPSLLQSQLQLLEIDASEGILQVDATLNPAIIVETVRDSLVQRNIES
ncbi:gluconokinase isoform X2 [Spinacia oleracea]|nr:gluconokinase isoform X2 [Spinacia oleracea]